MGSTPSPQEQPAGRPQTFSSADQALRYAMERHKAGAVDEAAHIYGQLLAQAPVNVDLLRLYGLALTQSGRPRDGLPHLEKAVRLAPRRALVHLHHGLALLALERFEEAAAAFRRASRLNHRDPASRLNLANALLRLGKAGEAFTVSDKVVSMAPELPEGWNNRGLALLDLGRHAEARDSFAQALVLRKDFPDAWVSLAKAEKTLGRFEEAEIACRTALAQKPDCVPAGLNLANLAAERGNTEQAEDLYHQILAIDPQQPEVRLGLANALLEQERAREAWELVEAMQPPAHLRGQWRQQRIRALKQLERYSEARAELAAADEHEADELGLLNIRLGYALDDGEEEAATALVERIEARLKSDRSLAYMHRADAHFGLGQFWHGREDHARAFAEWSEGHALLGRVETFSADDYLRFTAALKAGFDAQRFADGPRAANDDSLPVFIVGMPRSGTTLVEQILDCHPAVHGAGELPDMAQLFTRWGGHLQRDAAVQAVVDKDEAALTEAATAHLQRLRGLAPDARRVADKMPHNFHYLGLIALLFPGARIIYCRRDPRDVALSIYRRRFSGQHAYAHRLADLALALREHAALMTHWQRVLPVPIHVVDYEALVERFEDEVARLLGFLDLPFDPACLNFHDNPRLVQTASRQQVRRPLYRSAIGQWRAYEPWLRPLIEPLAADGLLASYG